ncbi:methyltransferase domain-containing protein [Pseudarthrobacter sp. J75]|uniref:methyltransferase domain-containing protein n=1 Tax=unclassified Pseudarthrobacter TaxID=2647000 RepID=UPI002E80ABED|nr:MULTISPECIES: methyltransferase domain-containing protein [unclassified Pseudarthrobacter]MEE2523604.1 methyltransferase domain-containing protein [Pseudarthrobacter sp. J47]MEE2529994.1 methyltransferase domain-containing protein [Pseudarthrobacter sp. J75]MEE2570596.1 methyltransferase domain-containing protein [Pseudarthrobacter sp. J64]
MNDFDATKDFWFPYADLLGPAYAAHSRGVLGSVRFEVVTRQLTNHFQGENFAVLDIGGGFGEQATRLAFAGHDVTVLDPDAAMLDMARETAKDVTLKATAGTISFVQADGLSASTVFTEKFDLVCLHSVLMYLENPFEMLRAARNSLRPGGLLSILSVNPHSTAMRPAMQRNWTEALATLRADSPAPEHYLPTRPHSREHVMSILSELDVDILDWFGVRMFTDHLRDDTIEASDLPSVCDLEYEASGRSPYRDIARLYHLIARTH